MGLRVLLVADSHLGFDLPLRPRVEKRRRGEDFFANHRRSLEPALRGEVDLVVHGGDLFFRSKVAPSIVARGIAQLLEVADHGVPVVLVPGNHERSRLPGALLAEHPLFFWFQRPRTFRFRWHAGEGLRPSACGEPCDLAVAGFPCERGDVRSAFPHLLEQTRVLENPADCRLLVVHQAFEGSRVGPSDFTFRANRDVIAARDLPVGFAAVLAGHIHRHQVLEKDLKGNALPCPVLYPGSVERTSFAESGEDKGFLLLELEGDPTCGRLRRWHFRELPTRPMVERSISPPGSAKQLASLLERELSELPSDAIIRLRISGSPNAEEAKLLSAPSLRRLSRPTQNVDLGGSFVRSRRLERSKPISRRS